MFPMRPLLLLAAGVTLFAASLDPAEQALLQPIQANTLKGHISFLASDALEGRDTPSRGLDVAAEYIASQFRRFNLEPAGDNGYFQTANYVTVRQPLDTFELTLESAGKSWKAPKDKIALSSTAAAKLTSVSVVKVDLTDDATPLPDRAAIQGKAVVLLLPTGRNPNARQKREALLALSPAIVISPGFAMRPAQLREAQPASSGPVVPTVTSNDPDLTALISSLDAAATLSANIPAPVEEPVVLKNIAGKITGSDPTLKETYLLLTAHYDHTGINPRGDGDRINNGANDDASGVATVLALAEAFSHSAQKPKRTVVFMTYFGEEKGLVGSRYYARHPLFPLAQTIANLNFEHMGRTDDNEGDRTGKLTCTGYTYTTLTDTFIEAGKQTGTEAWMHERNSDAFFGSSDNPDYHRPGDHWDKINYANMETTTRTVALTSWRIANAAQAPKWVESNPKVTRYLNAWKKLHGMQ
jgi:hypothetical protein